jgi:hypothetical protein
MSGVRRVRMRELASQAWHEFQRKEQAAEPGERLRSLRARPGFGELILLQDHLKHGLQAAKIFRARSICDNAGRSADRVLRHGHSASGVDAGPRAWAGEAAPCGLPKVAPAGRFGGALAWTLLRHDAVRFC